MTTLKIISAMQKVFWDEAPETSPLPPFSAFQNETLSFQAAYFTDEGVWPQAVRVVVDSPIQSAVRVRKVESVPVQLAAFPDADSNYLRNTPGLYPDRLADLCAADIRLHNGQWQSLWVDVEPSSSIAPGTYPITLSLVGKNSSVLASATTEVEILAGNLPEQTLFHTRWIHLDCLAQYYGEPMWSERFWAIAESFVRLAVSRGINMVLTPIHTPPLDTQVGGERLTCQLVDVYWDGGTYRFGFDRLRRWVEMCERVGVRYYEMAHLFTQWGARFTPKVVGTVDGVERRIFGWDVPAASDEYKIFLSAYLPALTEELKKLNVAGRTFFHISDEPSIDHVDAYAAARAIAAPHLQGFRIIDALSNLEFYQKGFIVHPIPSNQHVHEFIDAEVPHLWTYYCVGEYKQVSNAFVAMPGARTRVFGVQLYKYGIEGILHWGYNFYNSQYSIHPVNPYAVTDADGFSPSGDAFLVYPGANGQPEESMRMMLIQQFLFDLRALKWLESLTDRAFVVNLVDENLDEPIRFDRYPKDEAYLLNLREKVNREIIKRL